MLGDKAFRIALLISISAHSALFMPWSNLDSFFQTTKNQPQKPIEINYLEIKIRPAPKVEEKIISPIPTKSKISEQKQEIKKAKEASLTKKSESVTELVKVESQKPKAASDPHQPKGTYMNYYNLVRERIKSTLLKRYASRFSQGEIYLEFTLRSNGTLDKVNILDERSTQSPKLKSLTLKALQETSPFPPFPQELSESRIDFDVIVSFRK